MKRILSLLIVLCCYCVTAHALSITNVSPQVCVGSTISMTADVTGGTWSSSNQNVGSCLSIVTGVVKGAAAGTVTITYKISATNFATAVLTVNPSPSGIKIQIGGSQYVSLTVCTGLTLQMINVAPISGSTWSIADPSIATVDATTGMVTGVAQGPTTITYTYPTTGCAVTSAMSVNPSPDAITGTTTICKGATTTLTSAGPNLVNWSTSNPSIASIGASTVTTSNPFIVVTGGSTAGTATITHQNGYKYANAFACYTSTQVTVGSTITGSGSICVGSSTPLTGSPAGGTWVSSDPSKATVNSTTGVVTGVSTGTVNITYTSGTGCAAVTLMTVNSSVTAITGTASVCAGGTTTLSNATGGGTWSSSNVAIATVDPSGIVTGITSGSATITYTVSAGCYATVNVTVNASPSITGPSSVDYGSTITLNGSPTGGTWSSSAMTTATVGSSDGIVTGASAGTCTITYSLASGCYATMMQTVNPAISGSSLHVCIGGTGTLSASPSGGTWSGGDATIMTMTSVGSQVAITGVAEGTATITYTYSSGIVTAVVTVNPMPVLTGVTTACIGSTMTISVLNGSSDYRTGTIHTGNPRNSVGLAFYSSSTIVLLAGNSPGTDVLWYKAWGTNACQTQIDVTATKNESFTFSPDPTYLCVGSTTTLSSNISGGTWQIPAAPQYTAQVTYDASSGVVTGLSTYPDYTVIPVWYFTTPTCVGYTQIIMEDCGPKQASNAGSNANAIEYSIAPNPNDGHIVVSRSETCTQPVSVKIVSMVGATIYDKQHSFATGSSELSLTNVPPGMYIVELTDASGSLTTQKIVIQR